MQENSVESDSCLWGKSLIGAWFYVVLEQGRIGDIQQSDISHLQLNKLLEASMNYTDGTQAKVGDKVLIAGRHNGVVVADMDSDEYSSEYPRGQWGALGSGVMINTDFGGLVHYDQNSLNGELMELLKRA